MSYTARNQVICENVRTQNNYLNIPYDNSRTSQKKFPFSFGIQNVVTSFRGRGEEVDTLDLLFDTSKVVAVHGLGGYGKTQLVCHYAGLRKEKYCGNVLWVKGETENLLIKSFRDAALKLEISNCEKLDINHVIPEVYDYFEGTRVLFIIDNAQDYQSIFEFLPESFQLKGDNVHVLITSQSAKWGNIPGLPLQGLPLESALKVLSTIIGEDKFDKIVVNEWKQLAQIFYCIPLGLQIAGGYVRQRLYSSTRDDFSIKTYIARIQEKDMLLDLKLAVDSRSSYKKTIYQSLLFTVEKIEINDGEESKWALEVINFCAHLNPDEITDELLLKLPVINGSTDRLDEALLVLEQHSLVIGKEQNVFNETMVRIHRLVQMFFRYHQGKCQNVTKFYKDALFTVTTNFCKYYAQCEHVLADTNNLNMLLETLTGPEKKMVIKEFKLLHVASRFLLLPVMQLLLQHGADVNYSCAINNCDVTPLWYLMEIDTAIFGERKRTWEDAVLLLLKHKANITVRHSMLGKTILHAAAYMSCAKLIGHILDEKQLDVNVKDNRDRVPLHYVTSRRLFDEAEMSKAKECIQVLVSRNADISARDWDGWSVLHYSATYCNWALTEFLIDQFGMDSNMRDHEGNTPLLLIYTKIVLDIVKLIDRAKKTIDVLAKRGALMNAQNTYGIGILHKLTEEKYLSLIEYIVDTYLLNVNIQDCNKCTPLHYLVKQYAESEADMEKSKIVAQVLVQRGANINATNSKGVPILSMASSVFNTILITYLLEEHQADINQLDNEGRTPLIWTIDMFGDQKDMEATIKLLISKNANPAITDNTGRTILHHCALNLNSQLLMFFIDQYGLNPNEQDEDGFTALHLIAEISDKKNYAIRCINVLRNRGARVDLVNNENLTPAQLAKSSKTDLISFLQ